MLNIVNGKIETDKRFTAALDLAKRLTELCIPHELRPNLDGWVVIGIKDGRRYGDATQLTGSYGWEQNLLEVWGFDLENPIGWQSVDEALQYFINFHNESRVIDNA